MGAGEKPGELSQGQICLTYIVNIYKSINKIKDLTKKNKVGSNRESHSTLTDLLPLTCVGTYEQVRMRGHPRTRTGEGAAREEPGWIALLLILKRETGDRFCK